MATRLGGLGGLSSPGLIKLAALVLVGYIVITGAEVDPLILAALLSPLVVTSTEAPAEDKPAEPAPREETTDV